MAHWGYTTENGPDTWTDLAPAARGLHQSPVDIETQKAEDIPFEFPLEIRYVPENSKTLTNNGHTIQVNVDGNDSLLQGGPFPHKYQVAQFHFHWGRTSNIGSEHRVDGKQFAAELHVVHWNKELYSTIEEAMKSANGLAVLGAFLEPGEEHQEMNKLIDLLPNVAFSGDKTDIVGGFDPSTLLPEKRSYWTYSGSLTTPPCHESARFLIFKHPIQVSEEQLDAFRQLHSHSREESGHCTHKDEFGGKILQNFRPPQPLYDRKIVSSH